MTFWYRQSINLGEDYRVNLGGQDRRFKDNRQMSICHYGKLELNSSSRLNTVIMFYKSNLNV